MLLQIGAPRTRGRFPPAAEKTRASSGGFDAACADVQLGVNPRVSLQSTNAFLRLEGELQRSKFNECMVGTSTA